VPGLLWGALFVLLLIGIKKNDLPGKMERG